MKNKKIYNSLLFVLIFINILSIILLKPINNLDELWNYNFARNISNGLIPYRDFNMVITPLLSIICGIILKITFDELIIMRILAAILCSTILYITYKLLGLVKVKKEIAIIFTFFIGYLFKDIYCIDYNYASLLMVLIIIYREIKYYQKDNKIIKANQKQDILLGLIAGLAITVKQTTGLLICIALLGNKLVFVRKKEELKIYLKSFVYRLIGVSIPVMSLIIYLLINNAFSEFISYAIKGVSEFTNIVSYKTLINCNLLGILSVLVPITFVYAWIKSIILEKDKLMYILLVYGLAIFIICFPISDKIHFTIGALPCIIVILYELYNLLIKLARKLLKNKYLNNIILIFLSTFTILFLIYNSFINLYKYYEKREGYSTLNHFRYISINDNLEEKIKKIDKYISENGDVKILDACAVIYMVPIDKYNKDYDMFNKGNFGENGESRLIKEISESDNTTYLILKDRFNKNWQTPVSVIDYVKENKIKSGEMEIFDIYE